jgi:DnaJ family protein A protein 2
MEKTHYDTLNVSENAGIDEIKKAYRKLCLKHHPDKGGDVNIFKEISSAYETIGDSQKRNEYDAMRKNPFMRMNSMGGHGDMGFENINVDDLFANIFFGGMAGMPGMPGMPGMHGMPPGMAGMFPPGFPPPGNIHIFRTNGTGSIHEILQKPTPIILNIQVTMDQVYSGTTLPLEVERWIIENGNKVFEKQTLYVNIEKGVDDNEIIVLKDKGNVVNDTCKGDVKVFVKVVNNTEFQRRGLDLFLEKTISLKEALCGFSFEIKYMNNKSYTINNHPGNIIPPEYQKVIPDMGLLREGHSQRGNLIIQFHVLFPEKISEENIVKLKEIL